MNSFLDWAFNNKIEFAGTIFGIIYIFASVKQNLITWPAGIITSILYSYVFLITKIYAGTGLQLYYVIVSCYGWWSWKHGEKNESGTQLLQISRTGKALWRNLFILNVFLTIVMYYILDSYTDSPVPFGDAFTTSMSVIATWMMARKKLEHWLIWIFSDLVSISLYLYQELYSTIILFLIYIIMAIIGYYEWHREPEKVKC